MWGCHGRGRRGSRASQAPVSSMAGTGAPLHSHPIPSASTAGPQVRTTSGVRVRVRVRARVYVQVRLYVLLLH